MLMFDRRNKVYVQILYGSTKTRYSSFLRALLWVQRSQCDPDGNEPASDEKGY